MTEALDDRELMNRIGSKDPVALEWLYDRYEKTVYSFAYRMVQDAMAAEEVVQELFLRVWTHDERYDEAQGKLTTWIFTVTRNIAIDMLRRKSVRDRGIPVEAETLNALPDAGAGTADQVENKSEGEQMRKILSVLSRDQKQVIDSIYYGGMTQQEVSVRYNIPLGTVKSRVRLALKQMKKHLSVEGRREGYHG
ncbi:DNA-directed RNA polymerase sigma-70 factor [Paenibacillus albidus]|uniref:DNA-directed RNA polymerase sigma-70 factor n=1 Tax=Paenibacillus albidus TaxID=2041023 RepID=A0A917FNE7_9BACL|nr:sigma-70 family RNA polymerase sigma factor [Paenibacillus albidus]GGF94351.1 DNA-directed RNA polymerase sigma-70 factor [Paenibacillus albidus]